MNPECNHDIKGDLVLRSARGKFIYWHTYREWASYCWDARYKLICEYHDFIEDPICMVTTTCSKCGSWSINQHSKF